MPEVTYPQPWFKDLHHPIYATSAVEAETFAREGWMEDRRDIPKQVWPKSLYSPEGNRVVVGEYKDSIQFYRKGNGTEEIKVTLRVIDPVAAKTHYDQLVELGYLQQPVVDTVADPITEKKRLDRVEEKLNDLTGQFGELMQILRQQALQGATVVANSKKPGKESAN